MELRIELTKYMDLPSIKSVENKLLLFAGAHMMLLITGVRVENTTITYGRKMNKTRKVRFLYFIMYGWNKNGDFVGVYDHDTAERYLEYDLLHLRKNYLEFEKQWTAMHKKQTAVNNPLQTLETITSEISSLEDELDEEVKLEIAQCLKEDKPLMAIKLYKVATGKSLEESKEYIKSLI